jgi:PAS domain S-box-containing protein
MRMPISADVMEQMLSQGIRRLKDLHELSFGVIPRDISDAAMEATGCKQIVALAISYAEELIGTCVAYLPGDQPVASDDALKTYAHIVGLAVKRKQVEEKLKANEEKYRLLSEHTTDAVWLMDMNLKPTYQSPSEEKLRGYTPQEVLDLPLEKQITPESLKLALEVFSEEIPKVEADPGYNPVLTFDFEYYRKDGTTMWAESKFSLIRDENGKPVSILGEGRDITERKQVEEALRESETQYRMLAEHTADTVWLMNRDFKITYVSPTVQKLRGFTPQEILEMAVEKQLTPDSLKLAYELFFQELPKVDADSSYNPIYTLELEFSRKDGSTVWAESKFSIIRDGSGKAVSLLGEARDITERRQMEEALKDSEAKYRLLADNTVDGVWLLDLNLKLMYCSPASEKQSGFTLQEIMEMSMDQYFTPESLKLASALFLEELPRVEADPGYNPIITLELEFYKKDGTAFWAECKFSIIRDKYGKPVSILGQARDITERRRIESVLKESEEKYRMLVENALEAILIAIDGMLKFANYRATELTGYSQEELISRPFIEFIYPDDHQMVAERHIQRLKGMDVPKTYAFRIVCKQGDIKWVELAAALITWEGRPATLSFLTDITDRRRLEEERQRVERLESVGLLAGGIAHDFNNIMTAILGNISIAMVEAGPGSEIQESLEQAEKALLRAKELTRQLLTFSKGGTPVKKLASLTELLRDTVGFALRGSNIKCHFSIPADLWHAEIDAGQVSQVIHNLVINAQQAMPNGGFIELKAENMVLREKQRLGRGMPLMEGNYIRIAVTDHGSGIPADNLARVFDPFFTTKHKGSGLGLATAFSIAHNHNGHLSVVSALGSGSTFYFYLPASMETSAQKQDSKEEIKPAGKARILVMDDEEVVRNVAGRLLKHIGYEDIKFAADGGEALKLYKEAMETGHPFKVVILDLTIPGGMGGDIAVKKLLKIDPGVRAIVSSGYAAEAIMADYKKYGFSGMVAKPYTLEELSKAVQDVIG